VVKTASGIGHLVVVVAPAKGDLVLDNLAETIRPWQNTDYHWPKVQSVIDARFWYKVKVTNPSVTQASRKIRVAERAFDNVQPGVWDKIWNASPKWTNPM